MRKYTYVIHYTVQQETVVKECDKPIDFETMKPDCLFRFNTPTGTMTINMRNVTTIEEIFVEIDDYLAEGMMLEKALARNNFSAKKTAEELGWMPRTVYRKAKQHNLNVKND